MKRSKAQLNAISRAYSKKEQERLENLILEAEGSLEGFKASKYVTLRGYAKSKGIL